jgi:hypothetical protein
MLFYFSVLLFWLLDILTNLILMLRFLIIPFSTVLLVFSSLPTKTSDFKFHPNTVNAVLGDVSYELEFGLLPDSNTSEGTRIKTHLNYVIKLLETIEPNHLDENQLRSRSHIISLLKDYEEAGQFPKNYHFQNRRPVFIDRDGNLCAVGYLIANTEGLDAAKKINQAHKYDYIEDIDSKLIEGWLTKNGLSMKEAVMIQPAYEWQKTNKTHVSNNNHIETEYALSSSLLGGAQIGISAYSLLNRGNNTRRLASAFSASLGLASLTLGLVNVDNSRSENKRICGFAGECWNQKIIYKNQSRTNLSIANIIIGGASATFNGIRFFNAQKKAKPSDFSVSATQVYDPSSGQTAPALSFSYLF